MEQKFPLIEHDNHLIFDYQGQVVLIDIISPITMNATVKWNFLGIDIFKSFKTELDLGEKTVSLSKSK